MLINLSKKEAEAVFDILINREAFAIAFGVPDEFDEFAARAKMKIGRALYMFYNTKMKEGG